MRNKWLLVFAAGIAVAVQAQSPTASPKAPVISESSVSSTGIRLQFDRPMLTWNERGSIASIRMQPDVPCSWYWADDTTLACTTTARQALFHAASSYRLDIGHGLWSQAGIELSPQHVELETVRPQLRAEVHDWSKGVPVIRLTTNSTVTADAIARVIDVELDGQRLRSEIVAIHDATVERRYFHPDHTFALNLRDLPPRSGVLRVRIRPGLKGNDGPLAGKQDDVLLTVQINEPFRLRAVVCNPSYEAKRIAVVGAEVAMPCRPDQPIGLYFSRPLDPAAIAAIKAALPSGMQTIEGKDAENDWNNDYNRPRDAPVKGPDAAVYLKAVAAAQTLRVPIPLGLRATDGETLAAAVELAIRVGDYEPGYMLDPRVLALSVGSTAAPEFATRNIDRALQIEQIAIGDAAQMQLSAVRPAGARNVLNGSALPPVPTTIRDQGGLVLAGARNSPDLAYAVSYAPFDVLASVGEKRLLVWARRWSDGSGLAGAQVDLLKIGRSGALVVMAKGVTGADGVAMIDLPSLERDFAPRSIPLMVRVTHAGQRSLVPVEVNGGSWVRPLFEPQEHGLRQLAWSSQLRAGKNRSFGVTDRPLYRPGETVNYRLWNRLRVGNRLRAVAGGGFAIALQSVEREKILQRWPATLDAIGAATGALQLPDLLPDGEYCIDSANDQDEFPENHESGACFQVARFDAQALWAQVDADRKAVLAGQSLNLDLQAGYYSGGVAAQAAARFSGLLTPRRVEETYPGFATYTFITPYDGRDARPGADPLRGIESVTSTDGKGKAHLQVRLPKNIDADEDADHAIAFGVLQFNAEVIVPGKPGASSGTIEVRYAQYPRYVGLKTSQWWLPIDRDPGLAAVVVDSNGHAIAAQTVQVSIESIGDGAGVAKPTVVGHCTVNTEHATPCDFRASKPGMYRFRASTEGAAPTVLNRWIGGNAPTVVADDKAKASLKLLRAEDGNASARVELSQPYAQASVLFTLEYDDVVQHWVQNVAAGATVMDIPLQSEWAPGVTLHALVRARDPASANGGFGMPTLDASLDLAIPKPPAEAITVTVDHPKRAPGQTLVLHLSNPSGKARHATIAIVDDSIYQQAQDVAHLADPMREGWLGSLDVWQASVWYGLEGWKRFDNPFFVAPAVPSPPSGAVQAEMPTPAPAKPPPPPPMVVVDAKVLDASAGFDGYQARRIGRIEVIGSRIKRTVDLFVPTQSAGDHRPPSSGGNIAVRNAFLDSAYWNADLPFAAGASKDVTVHLPDNLTRWRVLVWTSDEDDGFALTQVTVETALPVELRAGAPVRLFVGDSATASISARNHGDRPAALALAVQADGAGVTLAQQLRKTVVGNGEMSQRIAFAPDVAGDVQIRAQAGKAGSGDALVTAVSVLAPTGEAQITQAGWIDADVLDLPLPTLPRGAVSPVLDVQVHRGFGGWQQGWLRDLREYPNRCWEQTLSRAVGAALAIDSGQDKTLWPDAKTVVDDALIVAPMFQDDDGNFRYFATTNGDWRSTANPALSAYTLRAFELLERLGFAPHRDVARDLTGAVQSTLDGLAKDPPKSVSDPRWETAAEAAGVLLAPKLLDDKSLTILWSGWDHLSWYGRAELVRALARKPAFATQAQEGIGRLRAAGKQDGLRRVITDRRDFEFAMGSNLRDQCGVVAALFDLDHGSDGETARRSLLRGLQDLYAGGTESLDTQASAQCLMALHAARNALPGDTQAMQVQATFAGAQRSLLLAPGQTQAQWTLPLDAGRQGVDRTLRLQAQAGQGASLNYTAQLRYRLDLRQEPAHAVGIRLQRSYQVLRDGKWVDPGNTTLREGDWVRVSLALEVPALRHFVAITDTVPGGLVSRDISLGGVAGADVKRIADPGSWWFDSRQTEANTVKLYAERLPPGSYRVHYYAQAVHPGTYLAPPAVAELMYGRASRATTTADRVVISATPPVANKAGR